MKIAKAHVLAAVAFALSLLPAASSGQVGPGGFDQAQAEQFMQQMRQRMMDALKDQLESSDEEFKILQPKIEKVMRLQIDLSGATGFSMMFGGGRGGFGNPFAFGQPPSELQKAATDLADILRSQESTPRQIKERLAAFRQARTAAQADLAKAREDLLSLLTSRQEAMLVTMGLLE